MPLPIQRYLLDPTGLNPDNRVVGELHALSDRPIRAIAPTYGPLFADTTAVLYDHITNRPLVRGQDYQFVSLLQEATLKYGKEIAELILIKDPTVSDTVRLDYQVLGGLYQNNVSGVIQMYETWLLDNRPVDWSNVLNKPYQYPPTLHEHLLQDIYGFEPVVVALERIRNAIVLSDVPAFEALIEWVKSLLNGVTEQDIDLVASNNKIVTFERLLYMLDKYNFNTITISPNSQTYGHGDVMMMDVSTTNIPDGTRLYWSIEHITTSPGDFTLNSGIVNITNNRGQFNLSFQLSIGAEPNQHFKIVIRKNSVDGFIMARSGKMTLLGHLGSNFIELFTMCCPYRPDLTIDPELMFLLDNT